MNILYLTNVMEVGGVEKCIIQLAKNLADNNKVIVVSAGGKLVDELSKLSVPHYEIDSTDLKNPVTLLKNILKIIKIIKRENIQIIHSHHRMTTLYAKLISNFLNIKLVHTQHLCIEDKFFFTKCVLKNLKVITVSNSAKQVLIDRCGLNESSIITIYNTVETESVNEEIDKDLIKFREQENFIIAQISRLVDYKGVYDLINIAEKVVNNKTNIRFVLIGDGPERNNLQKLINDKGLKEKFLLLGNKDNVITQLRCIDLVLLCSYVEGLPLVPLEAFSQGIPVIGTNIGGTNEEIENGVNGYLVEKGDIDGFYSNIIYMYDNRKVYEKFSENSKETFSLYFDKKRYKEKHCNLYSELLDK